MAAIYDTIADRITQGTAALPTTGTVAFWFKPNWIHTDATDHVFMHVRTSGTQYFVIQKFSDNTVYAGWVNTANYRVNTSVSISNGSWQHMALTWTNGGATTLYKDGAAVGTPTAGLVAFTTSTTRNIGNYDASVADVGLNGQIAHYSVWSRALTEPQITALQTKVPAHPDVGSIGTDWITFVSASTTNLWGGTAASLTGITGSTDEPTLIPVPANLLRNRSRALRGR